MKDQGHIAPQTRDHIDVTGATLLVMCSAFVGLNQVLIKLVNHGLQPVFQVGLRSACAFLPLLIYAWIAGKPLSLRDGSLGPGILAGLFFGIEFLLVFQSLDYIDVSRSAVLFYTMPFWAALGAHYFIPGDRLTLVKSGGLVLAVIGIALALSDNTWQLDGNTLVGDIYCLVAAVLWAGIVILARATRFRKACPEMQLLYQLGVSAVVITAVSPLFGPLVRDITPMIIGLFTFQVLVVVCFSFSVWFWLLSVYPASKMASFSFLSPVFGVGFGWLILGEELSGSIVSALVLVCVGVYLVNQGSGNGARSTNE